jgi:hypothetical protein
VRVVEQRTRTLFGRVDQLVRLPRDFIVIDRSRRKDEVVRHGRLRRVDDRGEVQIVVVVMDAVAFDPGNSDLVALRVDARVFDDATHR